MYSGTFPIIIYLSMFYLIFKHRFFNSSLSSNLALNSKNIYKIPKSLIQTNILLKLLSLFPNNKHLGP